MDLDILMPFHRFDDYLKQAIESLSTTKGVSFRTILIDDRIDKTQDIYSLATNLQNFEIVSTTGGTGYSNALNLGTSYITADCVALFNSDDLIDPTRFQKQIVELSRAEICITDITRIKWNNSKSSSVTGGIKSKYYDPAYLLLGAYGANASWCMRSTWWERNAFFDDELCLDWRIALNAFDKSDISYIAEPLYFYRKHKNQLTNDKIICKKNLEPVFELWNKLAINYGLQTLSYDIFSVFAVPWNKTNNLKIIDIENFIMQVMEYVSNTNINLLNDYEKLIKRRLILAIQQDIGLFNKLKLAKSGYTAIYSIFKDILLGIA
jgi:glycosyltransferase involved in cell wall biosynthesis